MTKYKTEQQNKHPRITADILFNVKVTMMFYIAVTCNCFSLLSCTWLFPVTCECFKVGLMYLL